MSVFSGKNTANAKLRFPVKGPTYTVPECSKIKAVGN